MTSVMLAARLSCKNKRARPSLERIRRRFPTCGAGARESAPRAQCPMTVPYDRRCPRSVYPTARAKMSGIVFFLASVPERSVFCADMKSLPPSRHFPLTTIVCAVLLPLCGALAAPFTENKGNLPPQVTFSEVPSFTSLNGLTINGFTFTETTPLAFTASSAFGPNPSNNLSGDRALSGAGSIPAGYVLSVSLATAARSFGFGFALQGTTSVANAVTLTLFNGAINLGSLSFAGGPDPTLTGGFAGIANDAFFNRVEITFNQSFTSFAVDNFAARTQVPETGSTLLMLFAAAAPLGVVAARLRRSA